MSALNSEEMERARRANPLPLDASWSTGDEAFDARIHASLMQRDEARDALEEMRLRAEGAEARIASVSGVTREELAKREYERGAASQLDSIEAMRNERDEAALALRDALEAIERAQHRGPMDGLEAGAVRRGRAFLAKVTL